MNCRDIEPLLLAERDGVLTTGEHAALAEHLAGCPACRESRLMLGEAVAFLKTDAANVVVPDAEREWRSIRRRLQQGNADAARTRPAVRVAWFAAPLAAAAALAVVLFNRDPETPTVGPTPVAAQSIDAGPVNASTIAYVDKDSGWLVVWSADRGSKSSG